MHELTLVEGVLRAVEESSEEQGRKVTGFTVTLGELAQFDPRIVRELFRELKIGTALEGARVTITKKKARIRCMSCGRELSFQDLSSSLTPDSKEVVHFLPELISSYYRCPSCSKSFFEIEEGRSFAISEVSFDE